MRKSILIIAIALGAITLELNAQSIELTKPVVGEDVVFDEENGLIAVEAEHFYKQTKPEIRQWFITSKGRVPKIKPDPDEEHIAGASGNAYLEILPDTRVTHGDRLIKFGDPKLTGTESKMVNFSDLPGKLAVVHYKVNINQPGRYYVWVRAYSTGGEDNGLHVGFNETWPANGQRMQWCEGKNQWTWGSKQRTEAVHCGVPKEIYLDIDKAGIHDIQFSMREDGFEFDKFILTKDINYTPEGEGPAPKLLKGKLPVSFPKVEAMATPAPVQTVTANYFEQVFKTLEGNKAMQAKEFPIAGTNFYTDKNWLAINPDQHKEARATAPFQFESGSYDILFMGVGENDGASSFTMLVNDKVIGNYSTPISVSSFEEGVKYNKLWENIDLKKGDKITVISKVGSADGQEYSRGRWGGIIFSQKGKGPEVLEKSKSFATRQEAGGAPSNAEIKNEKNPKDGNGNVIITGELKQWHKVTLTLNGPFATETDKTPNPFSDYRMTVTFKHESGSPVYQVPGYFAADGKAANTGAAEGNQWRAHLSPDKTGKWSYAVSFLKGHLVATADMPWMKTVESYDGVEGSFFIGETDKTGRDFRAKGRLQYVGKNHLQFAGNGEFFFKSGPDAPETLLAFEDFDNTITMKPNVPVKKYLPHMQDFNEGDPTWKDGKGKGLIGAVNYLSGKGVNAFSFLTYNAGGDGDNVWPFVSRNEKMHYDCSKLDQWQIVFDHAQSKGMYLHFKTQETENDDNRHGGNRAYKLVQESLDGGELGPERRLYYRELIARFGYQLALNWNLGEENTQTTENHQEMSEFFYQNDPYRHNVVLHTYPNDQDRVYTPLLGKNSHLTGLSLQNSWNTTFRQTLKWVTESNKAGKPWVVANDEQGSADRGVPPDNGYKGFDPKETGYDLHDIRKQTLWGNIMAGGAGVEYYFGYKLPENDLLMEDFRSRDKSWDFCRIAIEFLKDNKIPIQNMKNMDALIGNTNMGKEKHCLAKPGEIYLVYLAYVNTSTLDLTNESGEFTVEWFNPVTGGNLQKGSTKSLKAGKVAELGKAPKGNNQDWVVIVRKKS